MLTSDALLGAPGIELLSYVFTALVVPQFLDLFSCLALYFSNKLLELFKSVALVAKKANDLES